MGEDKRSIYNRSGLGHRIGYGKRPALLVVDMQIGFTAPEKSPLAGNLDSQVAAINKLITTARKKDVPIVFTVVGYDPKVPGDGGLWPEKAPSLLELKLGSDLVELDPRIRRASEDLLLVKKYASAFLGTLRDPGHARRRHAHCHRMHDQRMRARQRGRRALARLQAYHPARGGRRSRRGAARG